MKITVAGSSAEVRIAGGSGSSAGRAVAISIVRGCRRTSSIHTERTQVQKKNQAKVIDKKLITPYPPPKVDAVG